MIQLICNGVEVDVPRGTSIAWKNTNILFAFDKASCERSLTFKLPSTATNDTVFELCRLPQYVGQGFRRLYDAEYRDGLLVKRGYAYVTQSQKSGYNVTLVVGELTALKRLKDAGKVGEVLPDAELTVQKSVNNANIAEYNDLKVLRYNETNTVIQLMPSWCFRPMLQDVLNALNVQATLPDIAEYLRITPKSLNGSRFTLTVKNTRHEDVEYPTSSADADYKYNTLEVNANSAISVISDVQLIAMSIRGGQLINSQQWAINHTTPQAVPIRAATYMFGIANNVHDVDDWHYLSDVYYANKECKVTFPTDFPDDIIVKPIMFNGGNNYYFYTHRMTPVDGSGYPDYYLYHTIDEEALPSSFAWKRECAMEGSPTATFDASNGLADTAWNSYDTDNVTLAGVTIVIPAGTYFILARREDMACAVDVNTNSFIYDYQPRFRDYEFDLDVEVEVVETVTTWQLSKRDNLPQLTALDMLKALSAMTGKVLYYTNANGVTFENLALSDFTAVDYSHRIISVKTLKPRFGDYDRHNLVKYEDDKMTTDRNMLQVDYESDAAMLQEMDELQVLPFSCVGRSIYEVGDVAYERIRVINPGGEAPEHDILSVATADTYLNRQYLAKNATIQQLCKEPLTIEATLHMSNYEYSQIQPFSLIHLNGVDYVWTESNWQKGTATLTLSKLPLTLSEPQPAPPVIYTYYDYLEGDGRFQYIDTGVCVGGQWSIEIDYIWLSQNVGNTTIWICGVRQGTPPASPAYWLRSSNSRLLSAYNSGGINYQSPNITPQHGYSYQRHKNVITIYDGDSVFYTATPTLSAISSAYTHYLFSVNQAGTFQVSYPASKRLGRVRIYDDNDVLVRDFRPAVRIADGVAGMHDVVNDVFYTNANPAGDNFLYGNF